MVKPIVMDSSDVVRMLKATHYAPAHLEEVVNLCRNYPMFSLARMLRVRILEALGREKERELKMAAVYACDRSVLFELVRGVHESTDDDRTVKETAPPADQTGELPEDSLPGLSTAGNEIHFDEDSDEQADVIIEQHAPYAAPPPSEEELLELDREQEENEEISSETLIEAVVKEESEMEETGVERNGTPAIDRVDEEPSDSQGNEEEINQDHLIRDFIRQEPGPIRADNQTGLKGDVSKDSIAENDAFITDTLAKIYVKQGLYAKAIYAYEKLSLKYPEKSAYFAAQIEKIKNINHS